MNLYYTVYFGLLLLTLLFYIIAFREKKGYAGKVILLMILWFFTAASAIYLSRYAGSKNNLFIFHISTPLEYVIVSMLYLNVIVHKGIKRFILLSIPFFIALSIFFSAFVQKTDVNNAYSTLIESAIVVFLSLFFLREVLLLQQVTVLHRFPMFWISVAILLYYMGTLIIEGMLNYMINHSIELARRLYRMSYFIKYLSFVLLIIGAFCSKIFLYSFKKSK